MTWGGRLSAIREIRPKDAGHFEARRLSRSGSGETGLCLILGSNVIGWGSDSGRPALD